MTQSRNSLIPEYLRTQFNAIHSALLAVHKELLDHERLRYEKEHGPIGAPGQVLQRVINDPWFAWLRPLTALITQIDEFVDSKEPPLPGQADALRAQAKLLLTPAENGAPFQREYLRAIQESSQVASAHGQWKSQLQQFEQSKLPPITPAPDKTP